MGTWIRVAGLGELMPEGLGYNVKADGIGIALFQWEGKIHAIEDLCPHMGFPLSEGMVQDGEVICGWHGWHIRLEDGTCRREKPQAKIFPVEVRGEDVWIQI
jgi:nitrite reductase/ring-hydroxylating ferredoxin subunit